MKKILILLILILPIFCLAQQNESEDKKDSNVKKITSKDEFIIRTEKPNIGITVGSKRNLNEKEFDFAKYKKLILKKIKKSNKKLYSIRRKNVK